MARIIYYAIVPLFPIKLIYLDCVPSENTRLLKRQLESLFVRLIKSMLKEHNGIQNKKDIVIDVIATTTSYSFGGKNSIAGITGLDCSSFVHNKTSSNFTLPCKQKVIQVMKEAYCCGKPQLIRLSNTQAPKVENTRTNQKLLNKFNNEKTIKGFGYFLFVFLYYSISCLLRKNNYPILSVNLVFTHRVYLKNGEVMDIENKINGKVLYWQLEKEQRNVG